MEITQKVHCFRHGKSYFLQHCVLKTNSVLKNSSFILPQEFKSNAGEWAPLIWQPGSQDLWFNNCPRHVLASLRETFLQCLSLLDGTQTPNHVDNKATQLEIS